MSDPLHEAYPFLDEEPSPGTERMWPLDLALFSLAGLILYMVSQFLQWDDERWLYNPLFYAITIPAVTVGLSWALRRIATQYVRKSLQLGFLFSAFLHLLLMNVAVWLIIFPNYFPEAFAGVRQERSPIRKTIPEYLFEKPQESESVAPDWSQPLDAETTSRVVPMEERRLPPVDRTAARLEVPQPAELQPRETVESLVRRAERAESQPQPSDAPSELARRQRRPSPPQPTSSSPEAPTVPDASKLTEAAVENVRPKQPARRRSAASRSQLARSADAPDLPPSTQPPSPLPRPRARADARPAVGDAGLTRQRSQLRRQTTEAPAGASPPPMSVAVAADQPEAERMLQPADASLERRSDAVGAALLPSDAGPSAAPANESTPGAGDLPRRSEMAMSAGMPDVRQPGPGRPRANRRRGDAGQWTAAGQTPDLGDMAAGASPSPTDGGSAESGPPVRSRLEDGEDRPERPTGETPDELPTVDAVAAPELDQLAPEGPTGLAAVKRARTGVVPVRDPLERGAMDLSRRKRVRRDVGGPVTPAGMAVAAVESFNRRMQRTNGGAPPAPAGEVGPATEEAIELGLAYLASIQKKDGSWSLQGHGEDVLLQSDTAATGLCLLAFQGAGYTHRQHQYAPVVAKALEYLVNGQKTNGDLYVRENAVSDQNVALYSHGIASLALCEAYGMTQDQLLQEPAQRCVDYIAATQHRRRGGWRYTPQVSSDTSVTGWMMMAIKSGELAGLEVPESTYAGINKWLELAKVSPVRRDLYRYNPFAPNTPAQGHGRQPTPTMTAVGILMRMYSGWQRENPDMQSAAEYILESPPRVGTARSPQRDTYYWYYATQVMFHMGGDYWERWNQTLTPILTDSQIKTGSQAGSWDPENPVPDRWGVHGGRLYVTTMNLLNLEVYYRHLPIYDETGS